MTSTPRIAIPMESGKRYPATRTVWLPPTFPTDSAVPRGYVVTDDPGIGIEDVLDILENIALTIAHPYDNADAFEENESRAHAWDDGVEAAIREARHAIINHDRKDQQ